MANIDIGKMADAIMKELEERDCGEAAEDVPKGHGRLCEEVDINRKSGERQQHFCICA